MRSSSRGCSSRRRWPRRRGSERPRQAAAATSPGPGRRCRRSTGRSAMPRSRRRSGRRCRGSGSSTLAIGTFSSSCGTRCSFARTAPSLARTRCCPATGAARPWRRYRCRTTTTCSWASSTAWGAASSRTRYPSGGSRPRTWRSTIRCRCRRSTSASSPPASTSPTGGICLQIRRRAGRLSMSLPTSVRRRRWSSTGRMTLSGATTSETAPCPRRPKKCWKALLPDLTSRLPCTNCTCSSSITHSSRSTLARPCRASTSLGTASSLSSTSVQL
mmetsp:Transcript_67975/g.208283  ORF Transcript_67975/g.208283 Transcript_67975/m.208283 type:complete len:273 (-) Transcript_67975:614-1432(-)